MSDEPKSFESAADEKNVSLGREILDLLKHNRKWWLLPIVIVLLAVGAIIGLALTSPGAAPFIYSLF